MDDIETGPRRLKPGAFVVLLLGCKQFEVVVEVTDFDCATTNRNS